MNVGMEGIKQMTTNVYNLLSHKTINSILYQ